MSEYWDITEKNKRWRELWHKHWNDNKLYRNDISGFVEFFFNHCFLSDKAQHEKEMNDIKKRYKGIFEALETSFKEDTRLKKEISALKRENERLDNQNFKLCEMNAELKQKIEELKLEIREIQNELLDDD